MNRATAPGYDLFKLIVTLILVAILILMLLRGCAANPVLSTAGAGAISTAAEIFTSSPAPVNAVAPAASTEMPTSSPVPPTLAPSPTATLIATTPTTSAAESATATLAVTESATATPTVAAPAQGSTVSCDTSAPSRLSVGQKARVLRRLNMRNNASINAGIIQTNPVGSQVEIIGGPVCTPVGDSAYLWWQIRLANGAEGWSAETPLNEAAYFLEPSP